MIEEKFKYLKEQLQIANYGRVISNAEQIIKEGNNEYIEYAYFYKSLALLNQLNDDQAFETLHTGLESFPDSLDLNTLKAQALVRLGKFEEAQSIVNRLMKLYPNNNGIKNFLISIEEQLGNFESIIHLCTEILNIEPDRVDIITTRGTNYVNVNQFDKALLDFSKALSFDHIDSIDRQMILHDMGFVHIKLADYQNAKLYLEQAVAIDQTEPYALHNLGFALAQLGEMQKGIDLINDAIGIDAQMSFAYRNRAILLMELGEIEKAKQDLITAQALNFKVEYGTEVDDMLAQLDA